MRTPRRRVWTLAVVNGLLFLTKASMWPLMVINMALFPIVARRARVAFPFVVAIAASVAIWGEHNRWNSGEFRLGNTWSSWCLYKGNNVHTASIYPAWSVDRMDYEGLIESPAERARFEPTPEAARLLADEVVRWATPVRHFCRTATRDTEVAGVGIAAGESVALFFPSANRDEAAFDDPMTFRIDRRPNNHLGFGHGIHHCLGRLLALTELRVFFSALLPQLRDVEIAGPVRGIESNFTGGLKNLPLRVVWR